MIKSILGYLFNKITNYFLGYPLLHPRFIQEEVKIRKKVPELSKMTPLLKKIKLFILGFNSDKYIIYQFNNKNYPDNYLNDIRRIAYCEKINKKFFYIAQNKIVFDNYFSLHCNTIPKSGLLIDGRIIRVSKDKFVKDIESIISSLKTGKVFYLKPYAGGGGKNVVRLEFDGDNFKWNNQSQNESEINQRLSSIYGFTIEEKFNQHGLSNLIYPQTLNTIRIITLQDPTTKSPNFIIISPIHYGIDKTF